MPNTAKETQWVIVKLDNQRKIAIGTVYMNTNKPEHEDLNSRICESICTNGAKLREEGCEIMIIGDFNGHLGEESIEGGGSLNGNGRRVLEICDILGLRLINGSEKCDGKYTWNRGTEKSIIDYVLCSSWVENKLEYMKIHTDELSIGSDHNWITLEIKVDCDMQIEIETLPKWKIYEDTDWNRYSKYISNKFQSEWKPAMEEYQKGRLGIDQLYEACQNIILEAAVKRIGKKKIRKRRDKIPAEIRAQVEKRNKLEKDWKMAVKTEGDSSESRERVMAKFEKYREQRRLVGELKRVERAKRNNDFARKVKEAGGRASKVFWNNIRNREKGELTAVELENGGIATDRDGIEKEAMDYFRKLNEYQEMDNDSRNNEDGEFKGGNGKGNLGRDMLDTVTAEEMCRSIHGSKDNKASGVDDIPNELLKNMGLKGKEMLRQMFSVIMKEKKIPKLWKEDRISLIYKGKGRRSNLDNYRGISIGSNVGKCFMRILTRRQQQEVENEGILGEIQNAFRSKRRGTDSIFILTQTIEICRKEKRDLYLAFVDLRKAFDRVSRKELWDCMERLNFNEDSVNIFRELYTQMRKCVSIQGGTSDWFGSDIGVRQGCVASPTLFCLIVSELGIILEKKERGVKLGDLKIPALFFADDMVLMSNTKEGLQEELDTLGEFCSRRSLEVNCSKTKVMNFGRGGNQLEWSIPTVRGRELIEEVNSYKYLGVDICNGRNIFKEHDREVIAKMKRNMGVIKLNAGQAFDIVEAAEALWESVNLGSVLYGLEVVVLNEGTKKKLENIQHDMAKWVIGVPRETENVAVMNELDWEDIKTRIAKSKLKYMDRIMHMEPNNWTRRVYQYIVRNGIDTKWRKELRDIRDKCGINRREILEGGKMEIAREVEKGEQIRRSKEAGGMSTLDLYEGGKRKGRRDLIDRSEDSIYFFRVISGTLIRRHWEDRKGKCYHCDKVGWEEFHVIWECEGLMEGRRRAGLLTLMELPCEGQFTLQDVRGKLMHRGNSKDYNLASGNCFKAIYKKWENKKESADVVGPGFGG